MNDPSCRQLVNRALELSRGRQFEEALLAYQGAYEQKAVPWLLINIGRAQQKLGRPAEAITTYTTFLQVKGVDAGQELRDRVTEHLHQAQQELADKQAAATEQLVTAGQKKPAAGRQSRPGPPLYKKWWFWTSLGLAAAGVALGAGLGTYSQEPDVTNLSIVQALRKSPGREQ